MQTRAMNTNKRTSNVGFGLQRDITLEGAVIYLRITNPRRLNVKLLGEILVRYLQGGYDTLILDQGRSGWKRLNLLEFLGQLQATFTESRLRFLESKLIRGV